MKRAIGYTADDGEQFETAEECKRHETHIKLMRLSGITEKQILAALDRTDVELADAIEFAGNLIAAKRRADGGMRRKPKQAKGLGP